MAPALTVPLLCLLVYVIWAIALVLALTVARLRFLRRGGSVREFGIPDDRRLVWRLYRAHANAIENLPLFASAVLVAAAAHRNGPFLDRVAIIYICARVAQSVTHVAPGAGLRFNVRFGFFCVQVACLIAFVVATAFPR